MIAMEYIDMMSRMTMTASATHPRFLTISVMVKALPMSSDPPPCWKRKAKKPRALLPRMLNRIVTVEILQRFSVLMAGALPRRRGRERPAGGAPPPPGGGGPPGPPPPPPPLHNK